MTRVLPALHEGHAPIELHQAFCDAVEAFQSWAPSDGEPSVRFEDKMVPISSLFGRMRNCHDILPERIVIEVIDAIGEMAIDREERAHLTFADAAVVLRARSLARLRDKAA